MMMNSRPMTPWVEGEQFCDEAANETKADSSRGDDLDADDAMVRKTNTVHSQHVGTQESIGDFDCRV
ncbi:Hypothetical predicted protein [Olea europaea subsp. europaea]|uniref:Uncharacterized protein n=1 Tax=Olea europaea subsp. europaea TaxID=158383 RepID=A0A8S0SXR2_OLEEU|nr:Hypothetical predicted protein [Olea europaea subsp. europaea]